MKTLFGIGFFILGIVTLYNYPYNGYTSLSELIGLLIGVGVFTFLPGVLLIRSDNKNKSNSNEK
jgi:hypothetical protein